MGRRRRGNFDPPPYRPGPFVPVPVPPVIECYPDYVIAGEPLAPVYELDWETGMMKLMDPQPPHPFPEAAAAWLAAKEQPATETTPPAG